MPRSLALMRLSSLSLQGAGAHPYGPPDTIAHPDSGVASQKMMRDQDEILVWDQKRNLQIVAKYNIQALQASNPAPPRAFQRRPSPRPAGRAASNRGLKPVGRERERERERERAKLQNNTRDQRKNDKQK